MKISKWIIFFLVLSLLLIVFGAVGQDFGGGGGITNADTCADNEVVRADGIGGNVQCSSWTMTDAEVLTSPNAWTHTDSATQYTIIDTGANSSLKLTTTSARLQQGSGFAQMTDFGWTVQAWSNDDINFQGLGTTALNVDLDTDGTKEFIWDGSAFQWDADDDGTADMKLTRVGNDAKLTLRADTSSLQVSATGPVFNIQQGSGTGDVVRIISGTPGGQDGVFDVDVQGRPTANQAGFTVDGDSNDVDELALDARINAATGDETFLDLAVVVNKATSGNYTGIKLNVTETSAPGADDKLLDLGVGGVSKFEVSNAGVPSVAGAAGITDNTSYWLCTASDCTTTCQVTITGGLITGCP